MKNCIDKFMGETRWLSNFGESPIEYKGRIWPTVEHAFQAAKTDEPSEILAIYEAKTPSEAKKIGRTVTLRREWEKVKVNVMYHLLRKKYELPELRAKLLATKDAYLIEGNDWGDRCWGMVDGEGLNTLGELTMQIRDDIRDELQRNSKQANCRAGEPVDAVLPGTPDLFGIRPSDVQDGCCFEQEGDRAECRPEFCGSNPSGVA